MKTVIVSGSFDDLRFQHVRLLEEAAGIGRVHALLWDDLAVVAQTGRPPKFPLAERQYLLQAMRYVDQVSVAGPELGLDELPYALALQADAWVLPADEDCRSRRVFCASLGLAYHLIPPESLEGLSPASGAPPAEPPAGANPPGTGRKKVLVTGCYDWLHSGHVRFFEEVALLGELYVVVGHDENIRLLKGPGHPLFPAERRRFMVAAIRQVHAAFISTGSGWMDAAPQIEAIRPDIYAVNEDGDQPEKRRFCAENGLEYVVLKRLPAPGLPRRESTLLRGF
jgi:cytidyltransferase-like protein